MITCSEQLKRIQIITYFIINYLCKTFDLYIIVQNFCVHTQTPKQVMMND